MKYKNKKTTYNGIKFDSKKEMEHYIYLLAQQEAGIISDLELQKKFVILDSYEIEGKKVRPITYVCDFYYIKEGRPVVVDVKGYKTEVYRLKKKIFESRYNIKILEI